MKTINTLALSIPLSIGFLGIIINDGFLTLAMISIMVTGFIQVVLGIFYWIQFPKKIHIKIYFFFVALFFLLLTLKIAVDWIWFLPPLLCVYLSIIIYSKKEKL